MRGRLEDYSVLGIYFFSTDQQGRFFLSVEEQCKNCFESLSGVEWDSTYCKPTEVQFIPTIQRAPFFFSLKNSKSASGRYTDTCFNA